MARLLYIATHGAEDPTRAGLPFVMAGGAIEAGHEAAIILAGDSVLLMKDVIAQSVHPVGFDPLKDLLQKVRDHEVPVYVWGACGRARGVTEDDMAGKNARFTTPKEVAQHCAEATQVITF